MLAQRVPLNPSTRAYVEQKRQIVMGDRKKIIGVAMRGAGHTKGGVFEAPGHPIQPPTEELLHIVEQKLIDWKMDYVFLTTEENENVKIFQQYFGDKLIYYPRERYNGWHVFSQEDPNPLYLPGHKFYTTRDYLTEMEMLAGCDALIGSITSGLRYALIQNNCQYQQVYLLDYGRFPNKK